MDLTNLGAAGYGFVALGAWLGFSFEHLQAGEMGEVMLLEQHFTTVGPGPKIVPIGLFTLKRFPTLQIPLTVCVPVTAAEANRADFYTDDGVKVRFTDLPETERSLVLEDPLSHRSTIIIEISTLFQFRREDLYAFITKIGTFEKLGEQLGKVIKYSAEGLFSKVTVNTALERKEVLARIFEHDLLQVVQHPSKKPWGIEVNSVLIGPIELDPTIAKANTATSVAFAEKKRIVTLAEAEKARTSIESEGRARAIRNMATELASEEGRQAAALDASMRIYTGVKTVFASGPAAPFAAMKEVLNT